MKVLFAHDGSESAARAQTLVNSISWPESTTIKVLRVDDRFLYDLGMPEHQLVETNDRLQELMQQELDASKAALSAPGRTIETVLVTGRPASENVEEARRINADLIVLGSHGRGAVASALLGSVANEVVDHAPCPVLVSRTEKIDRLVLAQDGTAGALQAEAVLLEWPFLRNKPVHVISAWSIAPGYTAMDPTGGAFISGELYTQLLDEVRDQATRVAREATERLKAQGVQVTGGVREAPAADAIVAAGEGADLIVMGTRGHSTLERLLLGSVARRVLHRARCSVMVVPQCSPR
jgi:nucleotide-binding universal stress UspA family protein